MNPKSIFWVGTSWKMNKSLSQALEYAATVQRSGAIAHPRIKSFLVPPFTALREVKSALLNSPIKVGAQNMHWMDDGAWTGEISPSMLTDCGADMVELGHSERREFFGETDETVGLKAAAAVRHGLTPLICIGESLQEREEGRASEVLSNQVKAALAPIKQAADAEILIAYEPIWAIGINGIPATSDYADQRLHEIAGVAREILNREIPCLYGGSVTPMNCEELMACPNIDGLFIGRSALNVEGYLSILEKCANKLED